MFFLKKKKKAVVKQHREKIPEYDCFDPPTITFVPARLIEKVPFTEHPNFWNEKGETKEAYLELAKRSGKLFLKWSHGCTIEELKNDPECADVAPAYFDRMVKVSQNAHGTYDFSSDGRHRILAAQILDIYVPVMIRKKERPSKG